MKYIAPEMDIFLFSSYEIIATSGDLGVITNPEQEEPGEDWDEILAP